MARAMVLSAGLGTRLLPLTENFPKPLVPIGDRPVIAHIAERLARAGFTEVVLNTHHAAETFSSLGQTLPLAVHLVHEPRIRGTAGGVAGARSWFGDHPVLVWNGDVLVDPPIPVLLRAAEDAGMAFAVVPRAAFEGTVGIDADGRVVRLRGERFGTEVRGGDYVGVAGLAPRTVARLPEFGCLVGDVALPLLRRGEPVAAVTVEGGFTDIGSVGAYHAANLAWLAGNSDDGGNWIHRTARVASQVTLRRCVVGEGASIVGTGTVERVVAWPNATVHGPLANAIVMKSGRVVAAS